MFIIITTTLCLLSCATHLLHQSLFNNGQIATNKFCGTTVVTIHCSITNNVSIHCHNFKDGDMQLAVGVPSLHESVAGLELQLSSVKNLWNTIHGAEILCHALEEILAPSKKTTTLDVGCGIGIKCLYSLQHLFACLFLSFKVM